jgi:hypothetical protein
MTLHDWHAPDEPAAEERTWNVVAAAFREREPVPVARRRARPIAVACVAAALVAGVATTPGRAVLGSLRRAVGVEHARPVLFALPTAGRLLVGSDSGPWIVRADGSKRILPGWDDAAWSPFGRYVVATRADELAALDENGHVRWTLARPRARLAAWGGTPIDTRIAYLTTSRLHVVGGDGRHDVDAGGLPAAADVRPAWRPGKPFVVAYADTRRRIAAYEPDIGALRWRTPPLPGVRSLAWSTDGTRVLAVSPDKVALVRNGKLHVVYRGAVSTAALGPHDELAIARRRAGASEVLVDGRAVFRGTGRFAGLAFSPDGNWLLVTWPTADQWVFVHLRAPRRLVAASRVTDELGGGTFPRLDGWCCASH